jgi:hypothetical protein
MMISPGNAGQATPRRTGNASSQPGAANWCGYLIARTITGRCISLANF